MGPRSPGGDAMKLTVGQIHEAVAALIVLDDVEVKLSPETILTVAMNLNTLRPIAVAYEQARSRAMRDALNGGSAPSAVREGEFLEADQKMRDREEEVNVRQLSLADLNLAGNPKVRPSTLLRLLPLMNGLKLE